MTQRAQRRVAIMEFIDRYCAEHVYGPTLREIMDATEVPSTNQVANYLRVLAAEGRITYEPGIPRTIQPVKEGRDGLGKGRG